MKGQPNRLVQDGQQPFAGASIDRSRPLQFRLAGRTISGFAGDTVFSAALASGVDTMGSVENWGIGLSAAAAPAIVPVSGGSPLAMQNCLATDGAEYAVVGMARRSLADRLLTRLGRQGRSLNVAFGEAARNYRPWLTQAPDSAVAFDLIVVGAGVAGMAAALAGARAGLKVALIEAQPVLGGQSRLFGTQEGEEQADEAITRLSNVVLAQEAITCHRSTEVFAIRHGLVRAHSSASESGAPAGRVVDFSAPRIVLATGDVERLPVFSGNRLPGVVGAAEAFHLAYHYGVWPGRISALATASSPAYRVAMLARDAGLDVKRVFDCRANPQSRFIAFSKAYGITMAPGTIVGAARPADRGRGLLVTPQPAAGEPLVREPDIAVDRLMVCGGWQPDLALWHMAGGQSRWSPHHHRLQPIGVVDSIALAGSAEGWLTRTACLTSGERAVDRLLGRTVRAIDEVLIDPLYETPDGPAPVGPASPPDAPPTFLGPGNSALRRPVLAAKDWKAWLPFGQKRSQWDLAATPQPLDIADIAAGVELGAIPAESAGIVAQERVSMVPLDLAASPTEKPAPPLGQDWIPPFLAGRFGQQAQLWVAVPMEPRMLETGALIHASDDDSNPLTAIGVVVRSVGGASIALVDGIFAAADKTASLREGGRALPLRLVMPYQSGADLVAALRGQPGAT